MALRSVYEKRYQGVNMASGHFYRFKYRPYEHDKEPVVLFLHFITGTHPNSGHQWRLFQAINFHYIPRGMRKRFISQWLKLTERPGKVKLNWQKVVARFPYIAPGIRRYQFKPTTYISGLEEIERDQIQKVVVKGLVKDFSKRVTIGLRGLFARKKKQREQKRKQALRDKKKRALEAERKRKERERQKQQRQRARNQRNER